MKRSFFLPILVLCCGLFAETIRAEDDLPTPEDVRRAAERSLPFLETKGVEWIKGRGCASCHTFTFTVWAHREARDRGLNVPDAKLTEWADWAKAETRRRHDAYKLTDAVLTTLQKQGLPEAVKDNLQPLKDKQFDTEREFVAALEGLVTSDDLAKHRDLLIKHAFAKGDGGGLDNIYQWMLAGTPRIGKRIDAEWQNELVTILQKWQEPDGHWNAAGQLPSTAEQDEVSTAWAALAMADVENPSPDSVRVLNQANQKLRQIQPGKTIESLVVLLLWEKRFGTETRAKELLDQLLKRQNTDGGWSWLAGKPSDAFATGQVLYALANYGLSTSEPTRRGQRFLIQSQTEDGSWTVPPQDISYSTAAPRLKKLEPIYRNWGSAWATIGLLRTLPPKGN